MSFSDGLTSLTSRFPRSRRPIFSYNGNETEGKKRRKKRGKKGKSTLKCSFHSPFCVFVLLCLSPPLSVCLYIFLSVCLSPCFSVSLTALSLSLSFSLCLSLSVSFSVSVCLSASLCLSAVCVSVSVCLSVCLCLCLSVSLSVSSLIRPHRKAVPDLKYYLVPNAGPAIVVHAVRLLWLNDRLTAFVAKTFHQAKPYVFIDDEVISRAIDWMVARQRPDGSFPEPGRVIHKNMQVKSRYVSSVSVCYLSSTRSCRSVTVTCHPQDRAEL